LLALTFEHAVEFSRNVRAPIPTFRPFSGQPAQLTLAGFACQTAVSEDRWSDSPCPPSSHPRLPPLVPAGVGVSSPGRLRAPWRPLNLTRSVSRVKSLCLAAIVSHRPPRLGQRPESRSTWLGACGPYLRPLSRPGHSPVPRWQRESYGAVHTASNPRAVSAVTPCLTCGNTAETGF
jgi:hypothetical protein